MQQHPLINTLGTQIIHCAPHQPPPPHHINGMALRPPHLAHAQLQLAPAQPPPSQVVGPSKLHSGAKPFIPSSQLQKDNGHQSNQRWVFFFLHFFVIWYFLLFKMMKICDKRLLEQTPSLFLPAGFLFSLHYTIFCEWNLVS